MSDSESTETEEHGFNGGRLMSSGSAPPNPANNISADNGENTTDNSSNNNTADSNNKKKKTEKSKKPAKRRETSKRTFQTLLTATKTHHLKKKDGIPFWRVDIQYEFLRGVFFDEQRVFTNGYDGQGNQTFAEVYVDAMTRSSKCSKVLREKLLSDKKATINMAMVCLLVNVGRMNTTLNFFPEMRAQLRTYHPIPCLQQGEEAKLGNNDYNKQLQDAPRLKSILKGACEDRPEPGTLEEMLEIDKIPHTNPINLVFLITTFAFQVEKQFFTDKHEFFDLIVNKNLSSESRARAFLWLCWAYLETNLKPEQLQKNPFGFGQDNGTRIPPLIELTDEQAALENVDPPEELEFGHEMSRLRYKYLEDIGELHLFLPAEDRAQANGALNGNGEAGDATSVEVANGSANVVILPKRRSLRAKPVHDYNENNEEGDAAGTPGTPGTAGPTAAGAGTPAAGSSRVPKLRVKVKQVRRTKEEERRLEKTIAEADYIIRQKRERRRDRRYKRGAVRTCWDRIKDQSGLEDSEEDEAADMKEEEKNGDSNTSGSTSTTSTNPLKRRRIPEDTDNKVNGKEIQDWGEHEADLARALKKALKWRRRWSETATNAATNVPEMKTTDNTLPSTMASAATNHKGKMDVASLLA